MIQAGKCVPGLKSDEGLLRVLTVMKHKTVSGLTVIHLETCTEGRLTSSCKKKTTARHTSENNPVFLMGALVMSIISHLSHNSG